MATYKEQIDFVESLRLREGQEIRRSCPFCSGRNTFGATKWRGDLRWNCFRASCDVGGIRSGDETVESVKARLALPIPISKVIHKPIPNLLTPVSNQPQALKWLESVHSLAAYEAGMIDIMYSPLEDRIMFPTQDHLGYSGRARQGVKPKWQKYGDMSAFFSCGFGNTAVVVEDAPSACAVGISPHYTGVSILGTMLSEKHKVELRAYDKVLICLDPDASSKSLSMARAIGSNASMRLIKDDLKYFEVDDIERMLTLGY